MALAKLAGSYLKTHCFQKTGHRHRKRTCAARPQGSRSRLSPAGAPRYGHGASSRSPPGTHHRTRQAASLADKLHLHPK
jgi:hypothetical protein